MSACDIEIMDLCSATVIEFYRSIKSKKKIAGFLFTKARQCEYND